MRFDAEETTEINGHRVWRADDGSWLVEGWPNERYQSREIIEHLFALTAESPLLGYVNRQIVQEGGTPISLRAADDSWLP